jgi:hypothetical protein
MKTRLPNLKEGMMSKCGLYIWFEDQEQLNFETGERVHTKVPPLKLEKHPGLLEAWTKLTGA